RAPRALGRQGVPGWQEGRGDLACRADRFRRRRLRCAHLEAAIQGRVVGAGRARGDREGGRRAIRPRGCRGVRRAVERRYRGEDQERGRGRFDGAKRKPSHVRAPPPAALTTTAPSTKIASAPVATSARSPKRATVSAT